MIPINLAHLVIIFAGRSVVHTCDQNQSIKKTNQNFQHDDVLIERWLLSLADNAFLSRGDSLLIADRLFCPPS